jgi:hypothetical protein
MLTPVASRTERQAVRISSTIGSRATEAPSRTARKFSGSARLQRTQNPTTISRALARNGSRQPHSRKAASSRNDSSANATVASRPPAEMPTIDHEP